MSKKLSVLLIIILLIGFASGCAGAKTVESGDTVKVDYTGKLSDGTVFDTSIGKQPLEFTLGENEVIVGFEQAVIGMKVGETNTVTISAAEAYGERNENLIFEMDRSTFPDDPQPEVGMQFRGTSQIGTLIYTIIEVKDMTVTVDGNPPLAGKDLTFEITLIEIVSSLK